MKKEILASVLEDIILGQDIKHRLVGIKATKDSNRVEAAIRHYHLQLKNNKKTSNEVLFELSTALTLPSFNKGLFYPVYGAIRSYDKLFCGDILGRIKVSGNIEQIMSLKKDAALVFAPNHIDMLDTLVMGYLAHKFGMDDRIIHGGINLAVPGVKHICNNLGLYWVKRKDLSPADTIAYSSAVYGFIKNKLPQWIYIEGTRSRTGKLPPVINNIKRFFNKSDISQKPMKPGFTYAMLRANRRVDHPVYVVPVNNNIPIIFDLSEDFLSGSQKEKQMNIFTRYRKSMRYLKPHLPEIAVHFGEPYELPKTTDFKRDVDKFNRWLKDEWKKNMPCLSMNLISYIMRYIEGSNPGHNDLDYSHRKNNFMQLYDNMAAELIKKGVNHSLLLYDKSMDTFQNLGLIKRYKIYVSPQVEYSSNLVEHHLYDSFPLIKNKNNG